MKAFISLQDPNENNFFPCECNLCGWMGSSGDADGGKQIADTGDYDDMRCPICGTTDIYECDNDIPLTRLESLLAKAHGYIKRMTNKIEEDYWNKQDIQCLEEENKQLKNELSNFSEFAKNLSTTGSDKVFVIKNDKNIPPGYYSIAELIAEYLKSK